MKTDKLKTDIQELQRATALVFGRGVPERETAVAIFLRHFAMEGFAHHSTFDPDPRVHAFNEGKRHMWLILEELRHMTTEEIWDRYRRRLEIRREPPAVEENEF